MRDFIMRDENWEDFALLSPCNKPVSMVLPNTMVAANSASLRQSNDERIVQGDASLLSGF